MLRHTVRLGSIATKSRRFVGPRILLSARTYTSEVKIGFIPRDDEERLKNFEKSVHELSSKEILEKLKRHPEFLNVMESRLATLDSEAIAPLLVFANKIGWSPTNTKDLENVFFFFLQCVFLCYLFELPGCFEQAS
eukprot:Colp12_sorted_trinity150504_noHs@27116